MSVLFLLICFKLDNLNNIPFNGKKVIDATEPPTMVPGTDQNYINKEFTTESGIDQIQIGQGNLKQLSGCHFKDIRNTRIYYLHIVEEALIFDNIFENTEYVTGQPGCFWYDRSVKVKLDNCTFKLIAAKGTDGYVFNNDNNNAADITFNDCQFIDCGERNGGRPLINALDGRSSLKFYRCKFTFSDQATSVSILDLRSNDATFDSCRFEQCGPNAIYLCKDDNDFTFGTFKFTNNYVKNNRGRFINGYNMQSRPTIRGNTFEEMAITDSSFIYIKHNQEEIEFIDNTFSKFTVSGNNEFNGGGISTIFDKSNAEFTLKYTKCRFYDNVNLHNKSPTSQGGSLQIGFSNSNINLNINVLIENCEFKRNKAKHHGGAISIRSAKSISIRKSEFESNIANYDGSSSKLLYNNYYDQKTHGFGGAIYINPTFKVNNQDYASTSITIEENTFTNNRAYEGYAIYIEGEESPTTYSIMDNKFINNYEGDNCPSNGGIIASEVYTINKENIEYHNEFSNTESGKGSIPFIHVDHKGVKLPDPTAAPVRTSVPDANLDYINKVFDTNSKIDQIQAGTGNIKQISGCRFTDIRNTRQYYIRILGEVLIFDNIFENTEYITNQPGVFWYDNPAKITLDNCTFTRIAAKGGDGYVFNNDVTDAADITFNKCEFNECGERNGQRPLINSLHLQSHLVFNNCKFVFEDQKTSVSILDIRSNDVTFDQCQFIQCGSEAISLCKGGENEETKGTFKFTNNYVKNNRGRFINGYKMQTKPIIQGNTFTENTITDSSFILIKHNQAEIEFIDNTFSKFSVSGNNEFNGGGISTIFDKSNTEFTLKYTKCRFYDNVNLHNKSPTSQGGSLQIGFSNSNINLNVNVFIESCEFKRNKAKHHGGAISIRSAKSISIRKSEFESNIANYDGSSSKLLYDNYYDQKTHGFGGAIYINPTFKVNDLDYYSSSITLDGNTFKNNRAYEGYAIYIEGEESRTAYSISNNKFINNYEGVNCPAKGGIIASEVLGISKQIIELSNQFSNEEGEGLDSIPFIHVDHKGVKLPDPTAAPERTSLPDASNDYINKVFGSDSKIDQIQAGTGNIKQISGCRFTDIQNNRQYYIRILGEVLIFDNIFENTEYATNRPGCFWYDNPAKITLDNCTFTRIVAKGEDGYVFNNDVTDAADITFNKCEFVDCGARNGTRPLINSLNEESHFVFNSCNFIFTDPTLSVSVLDIRSNDVAFDQCQFLQCGPEAISLCKGGENKETKGTFKFTNNYVRNNRGRFINGYNMQTKPIIQGNTFEEMTITGSPFILIKHNQAEIEIVDNTFSKFTLSENNEFNGGGISAIFDKSNTEFTLKYTKCRFYDNVNLHNKSPTSQGGSLQIGFSNSNINLNINVFIENCEFKRNKAKHHGGAISIRSAKSISIRKSEFESNIANYDGSSLKLLYDNHYDQKTHGFGGAIYINPTFKYDGQDYASTSITIEENTFTNNRAYEGYAIYIEGEKSPTTYLITDNKFINNYEGDNCPSNGGVIASEIINFANENVEYNNEFSNTESGTGSKPLVYVDHKGVKLPDPTAIPVRTPLPDANQDYINKVFGTNSKIDQIQAGTGNIKQISGCRFTDIRNTRQYYIRILGEVLIFDNIFENTEYIINQPGVFWYDNPAKITLDNCTFTRIAAKGGDGYVFNNDVTDAADITFNKCEFNDCGERNGQRPLINSLHLQSHLVFNSCKFVFEDQKTSVSVLDIRSNDVTFDQCQFIQCGSEAISLCKGSSENEETKGTFKFTNNYVKNNRGRFINGYNMRSKPIIQGNTFTENTITDSSFILIKHNQAEIEFIDNTFSKFSVSGNNEFNGGGISTIFDKSNTEFTLKYTKCRFYDNVNLHNKSPTSQGGSLQIGFSNSNINLNINVFIESCEFKRNKAKHHGGAISIRSAKSISIRKSEFESNIANYDESALKLLYDNYYDQKTHGFGGAIYINPTFKVDNQDYASTSITIEENTFTKNRAYEGYAIYIEGEESPTTYSITNNKFINNYEGQHCPSNGGIIASEVQTSLPTETIGNNVFSNTEEGLGSTRILYVDHKGVRLPIYSYDDNTPTDQGVNRIEKDFNPTDESQKDAKIIVAVSEFKGNKNDDGGAIHLINCGLECTNTKFTECISENGGGGGIYIKNTEESVNDVNINNLEFKSCKAQYGGGAYICSLIESNEIQINDCTFTENQATLQSSSENLFGGSAIYLKSNNCQMNHCLFKSNKGRGGSLKVISVPSSSSSSLLLLMNKKNSLMISNCKFEIEKDSLSSIVYSKVNNNNRDLIVDNCIFTGKLNKEAHHIDGNMIVKSCKFSCDLDGAFKFDPLNRNFSIDLNNQIFNYNEKKNGNDWNLVLSFALPLAGLALVIVAAITIVILIKNKRHSYSEDQNEDTESNNSINNI